MPRLKQRAATESSSVLTIAEHLIIEHCSNQQQRAMGGWVPPLPALPNEGWAATDTNLMK